MIQFDAVTHTYTNTSTGEEYLSCTRLLSKYKKPFDSQKASFFVAKKRGISQQEVLQEWETKTRISCEYGTSIHNAIENKINGDAVPAELLPIVESLTQLNPFNFKKVQSEILLYNHEAKIAGTSDIIENVNSTTFNVFDFKTNEKFTFDNKYGDYLLEPVSHLQDTKYNIYSLQLSIYAFMYSIMACKNVGKLGILYHNRDTNIWDTYPVPYMKYEAMAVLKNYRDWKNSSINKFASFSPV